MQKREEINSEMIFMFFLLNTILRENSLTETFFTIFYVYFIGCKVRIVE